MKILLTSLLIAVLFVSCKKDEEGDPQPGTPVETFTSVKYIIAPDSNFSSEITTVTFVGSNGNETKAVRSDSATVIEQAGVTNPALSISINWKDTDNAHGYVRLSMITDGITYEYSRNEQGQNGTGSFTIQRTPFTVYFDGIKRQ